jgi:hypothetical protein
MKTDTICFKNFWNGLREDQKKNYRDASFNNQREEYINYLEDNYKQKH